MELVHYGPVINTLRRTFPYKLQSCGLWCYVVMVVWY